MTCGSVHGIASILLLERIEAPLPLVRIDDFTAGRLNRSFFSSWTAVLHTTRPTGLLPHAIRWPFSKWGCSGPFFFPFYSATCLLALGLQLSFSSLPRCNFSGNFFSPHQARFLSARQAKEIFSSPTKVQNPWPGRQPVMIFPLPMEPLRPNPPFFSRKLPFNNARRLPILLLR